MKCLIKQNIVFLLLGVVIFISCKKTDDYENAEKFSFKDFKTSRELKSRELVLDSVVMKPQDLCLIDSLLFITERGREKAIYVYNLKKGQQITAQINIGQGPDDMLYPKVLSYTDTSISILDMMTYQLFIYDKSEFISKKPAKPMHKTKLKSPMYIDMELIGNKLLGISWEKNFQIKSFDLKEKTEEYLISYPVSNVNFSDIEKIEAYYKNLSSNKKNKLLIAYSMTDLLDFYDLKGNLIKRLYGPEQFISKFKGFNDGKAMGARPIKGESRDAYLDPKYSNGKFHILYSGDFLGNKEKPTEHNKLLIFSEEGSPLAFYKLDTPIFSLVVDSKNNKFYGIAVDPEYKIIEYDL